MPSSLVSCIVYNLTHYNIVTLLGGGSPIPNSYLTKKINVVSHLGPCFLGPTAYTLDKSKS